MENVATVLGVLEVVNAVMVFIVLGLTFLNLKLYTEYFKDKSAANRTKKES